MSQSHTITSLHISPERERKSRMVKYSVAMGIRLVCIGACFIAPGWWLLVPALGAVMLPYLAVVVANQVNRREAEANLYKPAPLVPYRQG